MKDASIKVIVAIICITLIELVALAMGINGTLLIMVIGALCGLVGYEIKAIKKT